MVQETMWDAHTGRTRHVYQGTTWGAQRARTRGVRSGELAQTLRQQPTCATHSLRPECVAAVARETHSDAVHASQGCPQAGYPKTTHGCVLTETTTATPNRTTDTPHITPRTDILSSIASTHTDVTRACTTGVHSGGDTAWHRGEHEEQARWTRTMSDAAGGGDYGVCGSTGGGGGRGAGEGRACRAYGVKRPYGALCHWGMCDVCRSVRGGGWSSRDVLWGLAWSKRREGASSRDSSSGRLCHTAEPGVQPMGVDRAPWLNTRLRRGGHEARRRGSKSRGTGSSE